MGVVIVLCKQGDRIVEWDANDREAVDKAKAEWADLKGQGYEFYESVESKGKRLTKFNKSLGRVIAAPGVKKPAERGTPARPAAMAGQPCAEFVR